MLGTPARLPLVTVRSLVSPGQRPSGITSSKPFTVGETEAQEGREPTPITGGAAASRSDREFQPVSWFARWDS